MPRWAHRSLSTRLVISRALHGWSCGIRCGWSEPVALGSKRPPPYHPGRVATSGNPRLRIVLFSRQLLIGHLRWVAAGCVRSAPQTLHPYRTIFVGLRVFSRVGTRARFGVDPLHFAKGVARPCSGRSVSWSLRDLLTSLGSGPRSRARRVLGSRLQTLQRDPQESCTCGLVGRDRRLRHWSRGSVRGSPALGRPSR